MARAARIARRPKPAPAASLRLAALIASLAVCGAAVARPLRPDPRGATVSQADAAALGVLAPSTLRQEFGDAPYARSRRAADGHVGEAPTRFVRQPACEPRGGLCPARSAAAGPVPPYTVTPAFNSSPLVPLGGPFARSPVLPPSTAVLWTFDGSAAPAGR